jgi:hypothetical protein
MNIFMPILFSLLKKVINIILKKIPLKQIILWLVAEIEEHVEKSKNKIDDYVLELVKKLDTNIVVQILVKVLIFYRDKSDNTLSIIACNNIIEILKDSGLYVTEIIETIENITTSAITENS